MFIHQNFSTGIFISLLHILTILVAILLNKVILYCLIARYNEKKIRSRPLESGYFWNRIFLCESAFHPHETSESALQNRSFLRPLSGVDFFLIRRVNGFMWTPETRSIFSDKLTSWSRSRLLSDLGLDLCMPIGWYQEPITRNVILPYWVWPSAQSQKCLFLDFLFQRNKQRVSYLTNHNVTFYYLTPGDRGPCE